MTEDPVKQVFDRVEEILDSWVFLFGITKEEARTLLLEALTADPEPLEVVYVHNVSPN